MNLSESMRRAICEAVHTPTKRMVPLANVFDPALEEVKQLIWVNVWPSFKSSSAFESWRRSKQHKCFVSSLGSKLAARRRRQPSALEQAQLM